MVLRLVLKTKGAARLGGRDFLSPLTLVPSSKVEYGSPKPKI